MRARSQRRCVQRLLAIAIAAIALLLVPWLEAQGPLEAQAPLALNPNPPQASRGSSSSTTPPARTGSATTTAGSGIALRDNNYFVSRHQLRLDRGRPTSIGDRTDIGHWWDWFAGPTRDAT